MGIFSKNRASVTFDFSQTVGTFDNFFFDLGYDEILATTTPFGKSSLGLIKTLVPQFRYMRIHNLFSGPAGDRKGIIDAGCDPVKRDEKGVLYFDWSKLDAVYDLLIDLGYIPYFEFGFMPDVLSSAPNHKNARERYPPSNYSEWQHVIEQTVLHFYKRYGLEKIPSWCFELWNEPNSQTFWRGTIAEYCKLYDYTVAGVQTAMEKMGNPSYKIGGPALSSTSYRFMRKFIEHCLYEPNSVSNTIGTRLDFLSFHVKAGWFWQTPKMQQLMKLILSYYSIIDYYSLQEGETPNPRALSPNFEIQLTELDPLVGCDRGVNDKAKLNFRNTHYYAAFITYTATMLVWMRIIYGLNITEVFSDNVHIADEAGMLFKGTRNLTTAPFKSSLRDASLQESPAFAKPVVNAYRLLGMLPSEIIHQEKQPYLVIKPHNVLVTKSETELGILITNFNPRFTPKDRDELVLTIRIKNIPLRGNVDYTTYIVDYHTNNTYHIWQSAGAPGEFSSELWDKITTCQAKLEGENGHTIISDGILTLSCRLCPHSIQLYKFKLK